jgi:hypothetical protein
MPAPSRLAEQQLTQAEAIAFHDSGAWEKLDLKERALFQFGQRLLCMPFGEFQRATEELLGRPVWTHEFADPDSLLDEYTGKRPRRSMADIFALLPDDKTIVVVKP